MLIPFKSALFPASVMLACGLLSSGCAVAPVQNTTSPVAAVAAEDNLCSDKNGTPSGATDMVRKKCALAAIAKKYALDITLTDVRMSGGGFTGNPSNPVAPVGFAVAVRSQNLDASLPKAGDDLAATERIYLTEIAKEYAAGQQMTGLTQDISLPARADAGQSKGRRLLIVAHTDDIGDSRLNANFSERRAHAVARIFREAGIADNKIYFQGAGEVLPVADNRSAEGRMKNRRIEIMDLSDGAVLRQYLAARNARLEFYRINGSNAVATGGKSGDNDAAITKGGNKKTAPASMRKTPPLFFDFGGTVLNTPAGGPDIGQIYPSSIQTETAAKTATPAVVVPPALTSDSPLAHSCRADRPRLSNGIKALRDGKEIATAEFMPGLFSTAWSAKVHAHVISLARVAVSRDDGAPVGKPQLQLYKNYGAGKKRADFAATPDVNVYKGDKALLYRVFVNGPLRCMDIVIPNDNPAASGPSALYYDNGSRPMMVNFNPLLME